MCKVSFPSQQKLLLVPHSPPHHVSMKNQSIRTNNINKNSTLHWLCLLFASFVGLLVFTQSTVAEEPQVVSPDTGIVIDQPFEEIGINLDGWEGSATTDLTIGISTSDASDNLFVKADLASSEAGLITTDNFNVFAFAHNDFIAPPGSTNGFNTIGHSSILAMEGDNTNLGFTNKGDWSDESNRTYLGVVFESDLTGQTHFGWVGLSITDPEGDDNINFAVRNWSYQPLSDTSIIAGTNVPEPSIYAIALGLLGLSLVAFRHRRYA